MIFRVALSLLTVAYPFFVYYGLQRWDASVFVLLLLAIAALRSMDSSTRIGPRWLWVSVILLVAGGILLTGRGEGLKVYPILVNLMFLTIFTHSVFYPPTVIERLARIKEPELPLAGVIYTKKVTIAWIVFFAANGTMATYTAFWTSAEMWLLYNGLIAYILIGTLFLGEWCLRQWVRRQHA